MSKTESNPFLMQSRQRLLAGMIVTPVSLFSVVIILAFIPYPLFALFPLPTLMIGTSMITLELRNRIKS